METENIKLFFTIFLSFFAHLLGTQRIVPFRWDHALRGRELAELEESSVTKLLLSNVWVLTDRNIETMIKILFYVDKLLR